MEVLVVIDVKYEWIVVISALFILSIHYDDGDDNNNHHRVVQAQSTYLIRFQALNGRSDNILFYDQNDSLIIISSDTD